MPILEPEDYEEIVEHNKRKDAQKSVRPSSEEDVFVAGLGEAIISMRARVSRDSLRDIADEIDLSDEAWRDEFKHCEDWDILAVVNVETGEIVKSKLY